MSNTSLNQGFQPKITRAYDVGYGWLKAFLGYDQKNNPITNSFPAIALPAGDSDTDDLEYSKRNIKRIVVNNKTYIAGEDVRFSQKYGTDLIQHNDYVKTDEYLVLLRTAMSYDTVDHIDLLVLGLPHKYMTTHKSHLINKAKGQHVLDNGRIVTVDKVMVVSQPLAAAYNHMNRENKSGISVEELSKAITLTIESGWFTLDWTVSELMKTYDHQCGSVEGGAAVLMQEMMKEASKYTDGHRQLDNIMKFDDIWRSGFLRFQKDDLTSVKDKIDVVRIREAKKYFAQMKNGTLGFKDIERVVATGGSIHLYQDLIMKEFSGLEISFSDKKQRRWDVAEGLYGLGQFALKQTK